MKPIVIIGPMGSGKSSVAPLLGSILNLAWVDLDTAIEKECGKSILSIFETEGETAFRTIEMALFQKLIQEKKYGVIVTGGGAPCNLGFWALKGHFSSVWLNVESRVLWERLRSNMIKRPLLANSENPEELMRELLASRAKDYAQADIEIMVADSKENAQETAGRIIAALA